MSRRAEARGRLFARIRSAVSRVERGNWDSTVCVSASDGVSDTWRAREQELCGAHTHIDRVPFVDDVEVEVMDDSELRRIASRVAVRLDAGMWFGHVEPPRNRNARRETLRRIRRLPREEQALAGEQLRRKREDRQLRRRVRVQAENAEVIRVPDHIWEQWLNRHAA